VAAFFFSNLVHHGTHGEDGESNWRTGAETNYQNNLLNFSVLSVNSVVNRIAGIS